MPLDNLKYYLALKGISQGELAKRVGITQPAISGYINGQVSPKLETIEKMASVLDVAISDLINSHANIVEEREDLYRGKQVLISFTGLETKLLTIDRDILDLRKQLLDLQQQVNRCEHTKELMHN